jgi:hypothetical protein
LLLIQSFLFGGAEAVQVRRGLGTLHGGLEAELGTQIFGQLQPFSFN